MMSGQAKNFAKFAMRATPKNSLKAFSSRSSAKGFQIGIRTASVPGLSSTLLPIPPTMSNSGIGIAIPSTLFARLLSTPASSPSSLEISEELNAPTTEATVILGSIIEASEDLDAILSKIMIESSRRNLSTFSVILDFHAEWCGPCRSLSPLLEAEVAKNKNSILIKIDIDAFPQVAQRYEITSLPTVKVLREGKITDTFVGSRNKSFIEKFVRDQ